MGCIWLAFSCWIIFLWRKIKYFYNANCFLIMKISWHSLWERKRWQLFDHKNISGNVSLSLINTPLAGRNASNNRSSRMWEFLLLQPVKKGVCRMMSSDKLAWGSCWIQSDKYNNVPISHAPTRYHCGPPPLFPHCIFNPSFVLGVLGRKKS